MSRTVWKIRRIYGLSASYIACVVGNGSQATDGGKWQKSNIRRRSLSQRVSRTGTRISNPARRRALAFSGAPYCSPPRPRARSPARLNRFYPFSIRTSRPRQPGDRCKHNFQKFMHPPHAPLPRFPGSRESSLPAHDSRRLLQAAARRRDPQETTTPSEREWPPACHPEACIHHPSPFCALVSNNIEECVCQDAPPLGTIRCAGILVPQRARYRKPSPCFVLARGRYPGMQSLLARSAAGRSALARHGRHAQAKTHRAHTDSGGPYVPEDRGAARNGMRVAR